MPKQAESRRPRWINRMMRRVRRIGLYALLTAAAILVYLHHVGLPGWITRPLVQQLQARGLTLDYGRIALRWYDGIVAEDVSLGRIGETEGPELLLPEVALRVDTSRLRQLQLVVHSLEVRDARLMIPLDPAVDGPQHLTLDHLSAELVFSADDSWALRNLSAQCLGMQLRLQAFLTHASAIRNWRPLTAPDAQAPAWEIPLRRFIRQIKRLRFTRAPRISMEIRGDARHPEGMRASLHFGTQQAETPWGTIGMVSASLQLNEQAGEATEGRFQFRLESGDLRAFDHWDIGRLRVESQWTQSKTNPVPGDVELNLDVEDLGTPWGRTGFRLTGTGQQVEGKPPAIEVDLELAGAAFQGTLANSANTDFRLHLQHDLESLLPHRGDWRLRIESPKFAWGQAESLEVEGRFEHVDDATAGPSGGRGASGPPHVPFSWSTLAPWQAAIQANAQGLSISNALVDEARVNLVWEAPTLRIQEAEASLYDRRLQAQAAFDFRNRQLQSALSFDFDVRRVEALLPAGARRWLARYGWQPQSPPIVGAKAWLTLPPFDDFQTPDSASVLQRSLGLQGKLVAADASFEGIPIETVSFDFNFTNEVWRLTDFVATAPEGRFAMTYTEDQSTRDYRFDIDAEIDPKAFRSLVRQPEQRAFDFFDFGTEPPRGKGFVTGRYGAPETTGFGGTIQSGSFRFRGEPIERLEARLDFTNGWVRGTQVRLRSEGSLEVEAVAFDTGQQRLFLTGGQSTVPPLRVARAIGEQVVTALAPYQFEEPPQVTAEGWINVRNTREADMRFDLRGGPFHYWRFHLPRIQGQVFWTNQVVRLRDVEAQFYDGRLRGDLDVNLAAATGADFRFETRVDNVDVAPLMADLISPTNRMEGRLQGIWTLSHANSEDWGSWNGLGRVELRDGYLWDIPLFGVGTTLMDSLRIEAGRSRVKGLTADFTMTNSLIHTRNLQLQSPALSLDYRGTIDFAGNVDARVEARLLHETAVVGPLVSFLFSPVTKILEYKVTGTLAKPKLELLHIPKALLLPFDPVSAIRDVFRRRPESAGEP